MDTQELGNLIKQARKDQGLTQLQLSKLSGSSRRSIIELEKGRLKKPSLESFINISKALGYKPEEILIEYTKRLRL